MAPPNRVIAPASHSASETLLASLRDKAEPAVICRFKAVMQAGATTFYTPFSRCSRRCKSPPSAALQPAEVTLLTRMQPDMLPVTFGAQWLLTAHLSDVLCMAPPNRVIAPASHSASETLLASLRDKAEPAVICRFKADMQAGAMAFYTPFSRCSRRCKCPPLQPCNHQR